MPTVLRANVLSQFSCLGDRCEDTCCQKWSMQVDDATRDIYRKEAPELLDAIEQENDSLWVMRKNPDSGFCVKLEGGLCGIHKTYGDRFLGDACHFYPRVTRALGDQVLMTATMSCPEVVRRALVEDAPCEMQPVEVERLPHTLKNYLPEELTQEDALLIHKVFLQAADINDVGAEQIFLRIASASRSLDRIDKKSWKAMAEFYVRNADTRIPHAEHNIADPFNLLHALCGLVVASHKPPSDRLLQTIKEMEIALCVTLDWDAVQIHTSDRSLSAYEHLNTLWQSDVSAYYAPLLRRWLQMQLSLAHYPFGGLGSSLSERITIIGVRLATIKLALSCSHSINGSVVPQDVVVRVIQSLSRFLDHLGDPAYSLQIYAETGWDKEARMRGLIQK